ncbi:MAG TPA: RagB/SusD family nutrient uptake outer membrane protein [Proteiniphilum sp.]|nr:RagB/SusD family nutrient uptake outer membrane protein [Proteiniphilum sp.]HPJ50339.1 RagB/SusD family nutrient uptake outer membrane protein [Proteiniphilum sp.]HPR18974.1 RagB/SusD family nutrient uptake outer membrane protein [Proteiniphilum sp.]
MKTKYLSLITIIILLGSCDSFLDREPLDQVTPQMYFRTVDDLAAYTINNYSFETVTSGYGINFFGIDNHTDNQAGTGYPIFWQPGEKKVPSGDGGWNWGSIRSNNYFLENVLPKYEADEITGNKDHVRHYIGEMYLIRAYNYFQKLKSFGDFPIITEVLPDDEVQLIEASKRKPRNQVARFILEDLDKAADFLMDTPPHGKNRVSKNVAHLLRARVALYEGTWEKYHKGTAFVPGGTGWPGNQTDVQGFNIDSEIDYFLGEAMKSAKIVGDITVNNLTENSDTREGMDASLNILNPYYMMFADEDMEKYDEVLMWKDFNKSMGVVNNLQMELERNGGGSGWTRGMVNSFLMRNGLPIYADGSGYDPSWETEGVNETLQGRDSRIVIFTKKPGDVNFYQTDGTPNLTSIRLIFGDAGSQATTGYMIKKGKHYSPIMANDHDSGTSGGIVFRGTEAMLIYMEASYLKNSNIDATADKYWRAIRRRAKVDEDYNKTINATLMNEEAKWDFGAYSQGKLIDPVLYNIRRERRNELAAEAFRWDDLKRWRAMDQLKNNPYKVEGMQFWGSSYETELADLTIVDAASGNMSAPTLSNYIVPYEKITVNNNIAAQGGWLFTPAHYLEPIGMDVFRLTASDKSNFESSVVYQNPGWGIQAQTGPTDVE